MEEVQTEEKEAWHPGPPADAISLALREGKLFLVWIRETTIDDTADPPPSDPPKQSWQEIWSHETIISSLKNHTVSITLDQNTSDATMFLQLINSTPTAAGVWIIFAGQLLDMFPTAPSVEEMRERIQTAISRSEVLKLSPPLVTEPALTDSVPADVEDPETRARNEKIRQQLAARRAKLEAAKQKHGTPSPSHPPPPCPPSGYAVVNNRRRRKSITSSSGTKTIRKNRPRT
jgi:hypothetical protein